MSFSCSIATELGMGYEGPCVAILDSSQSMMVVWKTAATSSYLA